MAPSEAHRKDNLEMKKVIGLALLLVFSAMLTSAVPAFSATKHHRHRKHVRHAKTKHHTTTKVATQKPTATVKPAGHGCGMGGCNMGGCTMSHGQATGAGKPSAAHAKAVYSCPMHSDVTSNKAGKCPKCGMALTKRGS
jgi:hypothetical protein